MKRVNIRNTDLFPSNICFGTTFIGSEINRDYSYKLLNSYYSMGGNFIDTANVYADWLPFEKSVSEKTIGKWIQEKKIRDKIVLATKGAHCDVKTPDVFRLSRKEIFNDVNDSLKNLRTDYIDLYWLHRDDSKKPIEEIMETLNILVKEGKIRYFGCSNWITNRIQKAQSFANRNNLMGFSANQMMWNLAYIDEKKLKDRTLVVMNHGMKNYHYKTKITAIPFSSQANGVFHKMEFGKFEAWEESVKSIYNSEINFRRFNKIKILSKRTGLSISQIVLAYLLSQPFNVIPIIGCRTTEQLMDSLTASDINLNYEQILELEKT